ncbi:MAG: phosphoribosylglycinamide formyltransferase [Dehalococcoidia bacterium]|nr:phosphoribosylglycinamide formyltransferase [Dehalococcoidia bacterium]
MLLIGVLVSGRGSNLQALIDAQSRGELGGRIALVISNRENALALARAEEADIPTAVFTREAFPSRAAHHRAMADAFEEAGVGLVVLAGFDRILHPEFVARFRNRIINIHPSLLPAFAGGLTAQRDALEYGVKIAGCTVHFVTEEVDAGPIILQSATPVLDDDTVETLSARILHEEHLILPRAVRLFAEGRLAIEGRRVRILAERAHGASA